MDALLDFTTRLLAQFQSPMLAFLLGGILIAALGSRLEIPEDIYKFIVFMLLMRVGLDGGMAIREASLADMLLPALLAVLIGIGIVLLGRVTLALLPSVRTEDGIATAGLFGAVSGSTLAAARAAATSAPVASQRSPTPSPTSRSKSSQRARTWHGDWLTPSPENISATTPGSPISPRSRCCIRISSDG